MSLRKISVVGLGYVGLPVAVSFASNGFEVVGFDVDVQRIEELSSGYDRTGELDDGRLAQAKLKFTADASSLRAADFHIITVPTPITEQKQPDLRCLASASVTVGRALRPGDIVVYESTVYPGATESHCIPILEGESGLAFGRDFTVGYSPERINPGDKDHRFETIVKVVSGSDEATLNVVADVYGSVVRAGIYRAPSIKVAEAAKVIENTQRDLNIALINELALIFDRMDIRTKDVLEAAKTKWNFLPFEPGLVGGHCIGVDPYYLTAKADALGYRSEVILAGRRINDGVAKHIANKVVKYLASHCDSLRDARVALFGLTFKADVPDLRNSKSADIISELGEYGIRSQVHDPLADGAQARMEYGLEIADFEGIRDLDVLILSVPHAAYLNAVQENVFDRLRDGGLLVDVKSVFDPASLPDSIQYWSL